MRQTHPVHDHERAYRRPVTDDDVKTLIDFYREGRKGGTFESGIQFALERILIDPDFLFRAERVLRA